MDPLANDDVCHYVGTKAMPHVQRSNGECINCGKAPIGLLHAGSAILLNLDFNPLAQDITATRVELPDPTPEMLHDKLFLAIWEVIKTWDINVPGAYVGYCGATGSHARAIRDGVIATMEADALKPKLSKWPSKRKPKPEPGSDAATPPSDEPPADNPEEDTKPEADIAPPPADEPPVNPGGGGN